MTQTMYDGYDAIVIGGGPGGYVAAIRLGQLGVKTLVVEKEYVGGVCLNWGCIPSKALIAASGLVSRIRRSEAMGIHVSGLTVDVAMMQAWKQGIVKKLTGGVRQLVKASGAEIVMGTATLVAPRTVEVTAVDGAVTRHEASKAIVVATGARAIDLAQLKTDGSVVVTAREAVDFASAPVSMAIVGGGVIGLELGMVYQKLGTRVTVVELMDQILPGTDPDLVKVVEKHLKAAGAEILTGAKVIECAQDAGRAKLTVMHAGQSRLIECDRVLVAVGFVPNSAGLGLEALGVARDAKGHILVDVQMRTNVSSIYAIGDVSGPPYLAHKASKEGETAAEVIAGRASARNWRAMPAAIFTDPEIAVVGLTESRAKAEGRAVRIGKFPFAASGRAMAVSETDGFVKVIADSASREILGVAIVGPGASDLIGEAALAIEMCATTEDVAFTVHPHPTLSEAIMEAMKHALGEAIHVPNIVSRL